jgi:hypothetical protein
MAGKAVKRPSRKAVKAPSMKQRVREIANFRRVGMEDVAEILEKSIKEDRALKSKKARERRDDLGGMDARLAAAVRAYRPKQCPSCEFFCHSPGLSTPVYCLIVRDAEHPQRPEQRMRALIWSSAKPCRYYELKASSFRTLIEGGAGEASEARAEVEP